MNGSATARDYMSRELVTVAPDQDVLRAMQALVEHDISGAPVVDSRGNLVGVLTEHDCLGVAFDASYHQQPAGKVADYMSRDVETLPADLSLIEVVDRFTKSRYRRFPVLEGSRLIGQISRRDILRAVIAMW